MIDILDPVWDKIQELALEAYPNELCGVLYEFDFIPLTNHASDPLTSFKFDPIEYMAYTDCKAILHSHTIKRNRIYKIDARTPSIADRLGCIESKKPWAIICTNGSVVEKPLWLPRTKNNDYIGRPFVWFINDCYTLVQDYYHFEFNIDLIDHALEFDFNKGHKLQDRVFADYITLAGFEEREVTPIINKGDLLLINHRGVEQSHLGIYTGNSVLHQDILSVEIPIERFAGKISRILTHKSLL